MAKNNKKIIQGIKDIRLRAAASQQFKSSLKIRLADIHRLDSAVERIPKLHILRNFALFCSFFFVWWVLLFVLDSRDDTSFQTVKYKQEIQQDIMSEEGVDDEILQDVGDAGMRTEIEKMRSEEQNPPLFDQNTVPLDKGEREVEWNQETEPQEKIEETIHTLPETVASDTARIWAASMMMDTSVGDAGMRTDEIFQDEYIESDYEDSQAIYEFYRMEFYEICEENEWVVASDGYTCEFEDWEFCTMDDVRENSPEPCEYLHGINTDEK